MAICSCGVEINEITGTKRGNGKLNYRCKECQKKLSKQHYLDHKEKYRETGRRRMKRLLDWFAEYKKGLKCSRCGFNHPAALDFHHIGKKDGEVLKILAQTKNIEKTLAEIAKCIVLCANCHRIEHYKERQ